MKASSVTGIAAPLRHRASGFTLIEVIFATAISTMIALVCMLSLVEGMHLFRSNSTEMVARDTGSRAIRRISGDIQNCSQIAIYPNYLSVSGSVSGYGSCAVLTTGSTATGLYYLYPLNNSNINAGGIYYSANPSAGPNPATDTLLVSYVQDFEFRTDVTGYIRTGFKIGIYGYPTLLTGSKEADLVRFTTSDVPRNL